MAMNLVVQVYLCHCEASFEYKSRSGIVGFELELFQIFRENDKLISRVEWLYKVALLLAMEDCTQYSTNLPKSSGVVI